MLHAYFDETGSHDETKLLGVAGYIFPPTGLAHFESNWKRLLIRYDLPYFQVLQTILWVGSTLFRTFTAGGARWKVPSCTNICWA
jgi:hypothetical protein